MTAKEKARELVDYFLNLKPTKLDEQLVIEHPTAVACAKKVAWEAFNSCEYTIHFNLEDFWNDVIYELEQM